MEPQFYVSVLTDIDANRHYCACLCFNETVAITPNKPIDEEEEDSFSPRQTLLNPAAVVAAAGGAVVNNFSSTALMQEVNSKPTSNITHHSIMYAPKCMVLISRLNYIETIRVSFHSMEEYLSHRVEEISSFVLISSLRMPLHSLQNVSLSNSKFKILMTFPAELPWNYLYGIHRKSAVSAGNVDWKYSRMYSGEFIESDSKMHQWKYITVLFLF